MVSLECLAHSRYSVNAKLFLLLFCLSPVLFSGQLSPTFCCAHTVSSPAEVMLIRNLGSIHPASWQIFFECILSSSHCAGHRGNDAWDWHSSCSQGNCLSDGDSDKEAKESFDESYWKHRSDTWPKLGRIQLTSKLTLEEWAGETMRAPGQSPFTPLWNGLVPRAMFWDTWLRTTKRYRLVGSNIGQLVCSNITGQRSRVYK